ncbi:protein kinase [Pseudomonas sp. S44]|uniref:leucine-rich repeat-containing protein kinase family protein n=1 Tax=unclassified Pseudomonas TaxID=196821 RepID=UPI00190ABD91|nr:leucine-rich repeat-containing protein kinase family protein [Pseudomonas sp. S44]MBK0059434.1 protein kinase [Pseudomonas sp. S44]
MHSLEDLKAGRLQGITRLDLCEGLTCFPPEIFTLADTLEVLNLTGNALSALPDDLHRLTRLKVLFCSENRFTRLPHGIGRCARLETVGFKSNRISQVDSQALPASLRSLVLTDNLLETLPQQIDKCTQLQKLMLAGNRLTDLPESLARCERLELLRVASNRLTALPDWLLRMPRLAWLAYADNPLPQALRAPTAEAVAQRIDWADLTLGEELGRGASGVIHLAHWRAQQAPVAVKLYKGEITSDGSPLAEMRACLAAGDHPQLVRLLGRIDNHPQLRPALVMQLIDPSWFNLAGPPSLDSCTRDRYPAERHFSLDAVQHLLAGVASVAAHLHARGVNHGDLYAHNILCAAAGDCLLGDFGAASFHSPTAGAASEAIERLEVRAFGILIDELLDCCAEDEARLRVLAEHCQQADVLRRPAFAQVAEALRSH